MKKIALLVGLITLPLAARAGTSTINSTNSYAWGANIGWTNWRPDPDALNSTGVRIEEFVCSGYIWGANVGWINLGSGFPVNNVQYQNNSAADFGVNYSIDPNQPGVAILRGYAYGANIGWINFEALGNPRLSLFTGTFSGYAYSANCGWINLNDSLGKVQTNSVAMGTDSDGDGIADAFEYQFFGNLTTATGTTDTDGDGVSDLNEYLDGTSPTLANDGLRITAYSTNAGGTSNNITFASTAGRLYTIEVNSDLTQPLNWTDSGLGLFAPDAGTSTTRNVAQASATKRFFRVKTMRPLP